VPLPRRLLSKIAYVLSNYGANSPILDIYKASSHTDRVLIRKLSLSNDMDFTERNVSPEKNVGMVWNLDAIDR
jgi:hypothetical protein